MEDNAGSSLEDILKDLRESDPFRHDLLLLFSEYARGTEIQRRAVGQIVDLVGALSDRLTVLEGGNSNG